MTTEKKEQQKITAIASFKFIWDCPYCKKENEQLSTCAQMDTSQAYDGSNPAILNEEVERKCKHCGHDVIIDKINY